MGVNVTYNLKEMSLPAAFTGEVCCRLLSASRRIPSNVILRARTRQKRVWEFPVSNKRQRYECSLECRGIFFIVFCLENLTSLLLLLLCCCIFISIAFLVSGF